MIHQLFSSHPLRQSSGEKHIRRYAKSNKLKSFRLVWRGWTQHEQAEEELFFLVQLFWRVHVARELLLCALFSLFASTPFTPNRISFISEDFETFNLLPRPFALVYRAPREFHHRFIFHRVLFVQFTLSPLALVSNKSSIRFSIIHFSRRFRQASFPF